MKQTLYSFIFSLLLVVSASAQERYLDEVFTEVTVTQNVQYGTNISIEDIILGVSDQPGPKDLVMDIYAPANDTLAERPVVILAHRGDFLPPIVNQTPYGTMRDSAVVETCTDLAKRGFIAVSISYRLGWNPFGSDKEIKETVLQASYRLTQDMHTAIRFLRKNYSEGDNTYGIDSSRIAIGGFDSAAWGAQSLNHLKSVSQIDTLPKFLDFSTQPPTPFVVEDFHGNPEGTNQTPLNIPNHVGYSSEVDAIINITGGLGDLSWIQPGDAPIIGFQRKSSFSGVGIRDVSLTAGGSIIIPTGAFLDTIIHTSQALGNQDIFINANLDDELTTKSVAATGGLEGLYLYEGRKIELTQLCDPTPGADSTSFGNNSYPWNWYDAATFAAIWDGVPNQTIPSSIYMCGFNASEGNPNDPALARQMVDTLVSYMAPRLVIAMNLNEGTSAVNNALKSELQFKAYPNPTNNQIRFQASEAIRFVKLMDINGRLIYSSDNVNATQHQMQVHNFPKGLYIATVGFDAGTVAEKILVE